MKHILVILLCLGFFSISCSKSSEKSEGALENPLLSEFKTPFGVPPFELIRDEHFRPAFEEAMRQHKREIESIANNAEPPTFANTVAALAHSGELLARVSNVFDNLSGAHTNDAIKAIEKEMAPIRTQHNLDISLNEGLFQRIKAVFRERADLELSTEEAMLLEKTYKDFVRGGADLEKDQKVRFREINGEISRLTVQFGQNVLNDTNSFEMLLGSQDDLAGLPQDLINGYFEAAESKAAEPEAEPEKYSGKWLVTLHKPSFIPFLTYSERRDLREKVFKAFINVGNNDNQNDNKAIAARIAALRVERARLLSYPSHAAYVLEDNMAKQAENVYDLLLRVWEPALEKAGREVEDMQAVIGAEGNSFQLQPWDWWHYAEKVKQAKYQLDDQAIRPYFQLENVRAGMFDVANKLWGITFTELTDIPKYMDEVQAFEVKEADGTHIGVLYTDYYPRASKQGGAWMNAYRKQYRKDGKKIHPVVANHGNFSKPTADKPALISYDEALTMFHEFGHALHGLLSDCTYRRLSGTSVPRDFVELPSQIMEHWAAHPDVIKTYAKHYRTGEPIPDELLEKIKKAGTFNQGFATIEYLASCFLDMNWHTLTEPVEQDTAAFEKAAMEKIGLIPEILPRWRSTYFQHIFAGGYSSGYYSYIWAEVLDSDAFEAFKETSLFDQDTASALRRYILSRGGTQDPKKMYLQFRGAEPKIEPLLKKRGLL